MSKRLRKAIPERKKEFKGRYLKRWEKEEIGIITERKFFGEFPDCKPHRKAPDWIVSVSKHTDEDDALGIDAVVKIKHFMGEGHRNLDIYIQLKTSAKYVDEFRRKHSARRIGLLVISLRDQPRDFLPRFYELLERERLWLAHEMKLESYLSDQIAA